MSGTTLVRSPQEELDLTWKLLQGRSPTPASRGAQASPPPQA